MKVAYYVLGLVTLLLSCNSQNSHEENIKNEIEYRIDLLNKSYKFRIIPENFQGKKFDTLNAVINKILLGKENEASLSDYTTIKRLFLLYEIEFKDKREFEKDSYLNVLLGLDKLIFKYLPSRINTSNYSAVVVPNKSTLSINDTFIAKIYLTSYDTLYEPEFIVPFGYDSLGKSFDWIHLPSEKGMGVYKMIARKRGDKEIKGYAIYSNEQGTRDSLAWKYKFKVK
jgi:hypothetical protein